MGKVLVTGATGAVGNAVVQDLLARDRPVRALVRSIERARRTVHEDCELFEGDVIDATSVRAAMKGCTVAFHCAGLPEQWLDDPTRFDRVNVGGTRNMIEAALEQKLKRFVYTSTIDVFAAAPGDRYDESLLDPRPKATAYERSKQDADRVVAAALAHGLPAVFLHPAGVYGPSAAASPGVNDFIARLITRKLPALIPGGLPLVMASDVGTGHVLAEEKAAVGARFILAETFITLRELAEFVMREASLRSIPPTMPAPVASAVSRVGEIVSRFTHKPPLIPHGQFTFLQWQARPSAKRARDTLGWEPTPLAAGVRQTIKFLRDTGRV